MGDADVPGDQAAEQDFKLALAYKVLLTRIQFKAAAAHSRARLGLVMWPLYFNVRLLWLRSASCTPQMAWCLRRRQSCNRRSLTPSLQKVRRTGNLVCA